jgi:LmbE family N-acetylglucosaminyl deacetylase
MVVAHHDDALLWAHGLLRRTLAMGWDWTLVAMCVDRPELQSYFDEYAHHLGVRHARHAFKNHQLGDCFSINSAQNMGAALRASLGDEPPDWVVTHSAKRRGEYGRHANHHEVLITLCGLVPREQVIEFAYGQHYPADGMCTVADLDASHFLPLNYADIQDKLTWCQRAPDAHTSLIALGCPCPNPEGFQSTLTLPRPWVAKCPNSAS